MVKKLFKSIAICAISILCTKNANAQVPASIAPTPYAGTAMFVGNTGNYAVIRAFNQNLSATVWDGTSPSIGWYDDVTANGGSLAFVNPTANDPDVAIAPLAFGFRAFVVYRVGSSIVLEAFSFNTGTGNYTSAGTFPISGSGNATNPNIDAATAFDEMVITWSETIGGTTHVYARAMNFSGGLSPIVDISPAIPPGTTATEPDIALYQSPTGTFVHYTYLVNTTSGQTLIHRYEPLANLWAGFTAPTTNFVDGTSYASSQSMSRPRIAGNANSGVSGGDGAAITYGKEIQNTQLIFSYCQLSGAPMQVMTLPSLIGCLNKYPVITWSPSCQEYTVGWNHQNTCGSGLIGNNIIARKLSITGIPFGPHQLVNIALGDKANISLSGRFASASTSIMSSYHNFVGNVALYKFSNCSSSPFMREAQEAQDLELNSLSVYPNPASDLIHVEGNELESIAIYSVSGQLVKQIQLAKENATQLNVSDMPAGFYFLEVNDANGQQKERISIQ